MTHDIARLQHLARAGDPAAAVKLRRYWCRISSGPLHHVQSLTEYAEAYFERSYGSEPTQSGLYQSVVGDPRDPRRITEKGVRVGSGCINLRMFYVVERSGVASPLISTWDDPDRSITLTDLS